MVTSDRTMYKQYNYFQKKLKELKIIVLTTVM